MSKKEYEGLEERYVFFGPENVCAYCGDAADTVDHAVPRSLVAENRRFFAHFKLVKLAACQSCNSNLIDRFFPTFRERRAFLHQHFRKKWRPLLESPSWSDEEIEDLGYGLAVNLKQNRAVRGFLVRRIDVLSRTSPPAGIPDALVIGGTRDLAWSEPESVPISDEDRLAPKAAISQHAIQSREREKRLKQRRAELSEWKKQKLAKIIEEERRKQISRENRPAFAGERKASKYELGKFRNNQRKWLDIAMKNRLPFIEKRITGFRSGGFRVPKQALIIAIGVHRKMKTYTKGFAWKKFIYDRGCCTFAEYCEKRAKIYADKSGLRLSDARCDMAIYNACGLFAICCPETGRILRGPGMDQDTLRWTGDRWMRGRLVSRGPYGWSLPVPGLTAP